MRCERVGGRRSRAGPLLLGVSTLVHWFPRTVTWDPLVADILQVMEQSYLSRRLDNFWLVLHDDPQLWEPSRELDCSTTNPTANVDNCSRLSMFRLVVIVDQSSV